MPHRVSRRAILIAPVLAQATTKQIRRELFRASPKPGVAVMAYAFYTSAHGGDMKTIEQHWTRSDTIDIAYLHHSHDNVLTWTKPEELRTGERTAEGMLRRHPRACFVDPHTKRY